MSIIKERVRFNSNLIGISGNTNIITGNTINFKFSLGLKDNFIGYQQEIDSLTSFTTIDLVNPVVDEEKRKFKLNPLPDSTITLQFKFYSGTSSPPYQTSFKNAGFTDNEINQNNFNLLNSFFILDFYNTYDINTQIKIFTTYLTKKGATPIYSINANINNQLYYWYVPISYMTGTTAIGYVKFSFFNAKTGKLTLFYNENNITPETAEKLFFKVELNQVNKTWKFLTSQYPIINAKEFINSTQYINRINNTYDKFDNLSQTYPTGNTFNYLEGNYFTT